MKLFDPHIHMTSRTTDDYQRMAEAGVAALVEPAFWLGQPRTHVGTFEDYFSGLLGWERFRASQFGIRHFCTIALNPKEANNPDVADGVMALLPRWLEKDGVVAVGEIGYDDMTPAEDKYLAAQLELAKAHQLPVLVHTPHRDKKRGTERTLAVLREVHFPESSFNQMVLKAIFIEVPVGRILGLEDRITPELRRMAADYASERRAAARSVPEDVAYLLGENGSRS